eukprot:TRINITY_DN951_c0_g1_i1.p2 TRINITY_DN951_c0_g1~~TRINITY_DN951_c0_g1_i1.p2  ORF type:complete len:66 (-),score=16.40 TRINITY_DN951_c0_g1_i1:379-576(-)
MGGRSSETNVADIPVDFKQLSKKLDEIVEKTDASLKLQEKTDRGGTAVDKMQDEIISFLSDEQKE